MKKITGILLTTCLYTLSFQTALAQDTKTAMVPLPSIDDFTRGNDGWAFGLGLGVEYESAYEGSDEFGVEVDPAGAVQWRKGDNIFFWAGEAIGWRGLRSDTCLLYTSPSPRD